MSNTERTAMLGGVPGLEDLPDPAGRHVLVRADLDVPVSFSGPLSEARQLRQLGPTVEWLLGRRAEVTICGHQGPLGHTGDPERFARTADALHCSIPG